MQHFDQSFLTIHKADDFNNIYDVKVLLYKGNCFNPVFLGPIYFFS